MELKFRTAEEADIASLVAMLADDELGQQREDLSFPLNQNYLAAFSAINRDDNEELSHNNFPDLLSLIFCLYKAEKVRCSHST